MSGLGAVRHLSISLPTAATLRENDSGVDVMHVMTNLLSSN
jgi:hypothetical protein